MAPLPFPCRFLRCFLLLVWLFDGVGPVARGSNLVWTGAFSDDWAFNGGGALTNWAGLVPTGGDDVLNFPASGGNKAMNNNFPANTIFLQLRFAAAGYSLTGNSFDLDAEISTAPEILVAHGGGTTVIKNDFREISLSETLSLRVTNAAAVLELGGEINGSFKVLGAGTVELRGGQDYKSTGSVTVGDGTDSPTLRVGTDITGSVAVNVGATLAGRGDFGDALSDTLSIAGKASPGDVTGGFQTTIFQVPGNLVFTSTASALIELKSLGAGSDGFLVSGSVTTGGATLELDPLRGFPIGSAFRVVEKVSSGPINNSQPFRLPSGQAITEGFEANIGTNRFRFSYTGGDGNDFTAAVVLAPQSGVREWDAGGSTRLFSEAANWSANLLPIATNVLRFGSAPPTVPLDERFPVNNLGGNFFALEFTSGGYSLEEDPAGGNGSDLTLAAGITASHTSGGVNIEQDIILGAPQTFSLTGTSPLSFGLNQIINTNGHILTLNNSNTSEMRFNGPITGLGGLIKNGSGLVRMGGASVNTYTGLTRVTQGQLQLSRSVGNAAVPGALIIGGGASAAVVTINAVNQIADAATVTVLPNGRLEMGAAETVGHLELQGGSVSGNAALTILRNIIATENAVIPGPIHMDVSTVPLSDLNTWDIAPGKTVTHDGPLTDSPDAGLAGVTQRKTGRGTLALTGAATDTNFLLSEGTLLMNTTSPDAASVVLSGGTLGGSGNVRNVSSNARASVLTAGPVGNTGRLTASALTLDTTITVEVDILTFGHDILALAAGTGTGQARLGNARLQLNQIAPLPVGTSLIILDNDGVDAVIGRFAGLPEGGLAASETNTYRISYTGGTGNDITLTAIAAPELEVSTEVDIGAIADGLSLFFPPAKVRESNSRTLFLHNRGSAPLTLTGSPRIQITGPDAAFFTVLVQPPASLASGTFSSFTLRFAPQSGGPKTAQLTIASNDSDEASYDLTLNATALPAPLITAFTVIPPASGNPGSANISLTGSNPDTLMRLEASANLTNWTVLRTFTTDSLGNAVTGTINDPTHTTRSRRFYRAVIP